jgi:hypothetical protein
MITLILYFCLSAPLLGCQEVRMSEPSIYECMLDGQVQAPRWLADHPNYELAHWRCVTGKEL